MKLMSRKQLLVMGIALLMATTMATGCAKNQSGDQKSAVSGNVKVTGSTSIEPLAHELAEEFQIDNPDVQISVTGGGSSVGIKAAQDGVADIGMSSRELKSEEQGLKEFVIAKDGIAVVLHPENKVADLSLEQIKKMYSGEIKNWKDVGGADAPITLVTREEASGTRGAFEELVMGKEAKIVNTAVVQSSTGAIRTTVAGDANAIGYMSMGALDNQVKAVKVDGVEGTEENAKNGSYKITRPFLFVTKAEPTGGAKAFIDWVLGEDGQRIIGEEFISIK